MRLRHGLFSDEEGDQEGEGNDAGIELIKGAPMCGGEGDRTDAAGHSQSRGLKGAQDKGCGDDQEKQTGQAQTGFPFHGGGLLLRYAISIRQYPVKGKQNID